MKVIGNSGQRGFSPAKTIWGKLYNRWIYSGTLQFDPYNWGLCFRKNGTNGSETVGIWGREGAMSQDVRTHRWADTGVPGVFMVARVFWSPQCHSHYPQIVIYWVLGWFLDDLDTQYGSIWYIDYWFLSMSLFIPMIFWDDWESRIFFDGVPWVPHFHWLISWSFSLVGHGSGFSLPHFHTIFHSVGDIPHDIF